MAFKVDIEGFVPVFFGAKRIHWQRNTRIGAKQVNLPFMRQHIVNQRFNTVFRRNIIYQKAIGLRLLRHFQIRANDRRAFGAKLIHQSTTNASRRTGHHDNLIL